MLPLNLSFKRILLQTNKKMKKKVLEKYDNLLALRNHMINEKYLAQKRKNNNLEAKLIGDINTISKEINNLLQPYEKDYKEIHEFYLEAHAKSYRQGYLLQLPTEWKLSIFLLKRLRRFIWLTIKNKAITLKTFISSK